MDESRRSDSAPARRRRFSIGQLMVVIALFAFPLGLISTTARARGSERVLAILAVTWLLPLGATLALFVVRRDHPDRPGVRSVGSAVALFVALLINLALIIHLLGVLRARAYSARGDFPTGAVFTLAATTAMGWSGFGIVLRAVRRARRARESLPYGVRHPLGDAEGTRPEHQP